MRGNFAPSPPSLGRERQLFSLIHANLNTLKSALLMIDRWITILIIFSPVSIISRKLGVNEAENLTQEYSLCLNL